MALDTPVKESSRPTSLPADRPSEERPAPSQAIGAGQWLVLDEVSWDAYEKIGQALQERPRLRLTYDRGRLEIVTTSGEHEKLKSRLGRFLAILAEEFDLDYEPGGSMTFKREEVARGLEPDECYWIHNEPQMRGRLDYDPASDPPPDLVLEIKVSRTVLDRLALYAALGVPEVWRVSRTAIQVLRLREDGTYGPEPASPTFPGADLDGLLPFLQSDQQVRFRELLSQVRAWARGQATGGREQP